MGRLAMVLAAALLCCGLMSGGATAQDSAARKFTEAVAQGLAAKIPTSKIVVTGDLTMSIKMADGREVTLSVANLYSDYRHDPTSLSAIIDVYAAGLAEKRPPGEPAGLDRTRIVPVVKDRAWLEESQRSVKAKAPTQEFLSEDLNAQLVILYAEDTANRTRYLMAHEYTGDRKELRTLAVNNLIRLLPQIEMRQDDDVSLLSAGGDYEASLLLFDSMWSDGQVKVNGDIVVAIPSKDILLVTGSKNRKGLATMRELTKKLAAESRYRITEDLFVYRKADSRNLAGTSRCLIVVWRVGCRALPGFA